MRLRAPGPRRPPAPQVSARGCRGSQPPPSEVARGRRGSGHRLPGAAEGLGQGRWAVRAERSLAGHRCGAHRPPHGPHLSPRAVTSVWVSARPEQRVLGREHWVITGSPASSPSSSFSPVKASLLYRPPVPLSRSPRKINQHRIYLLPGFPRALGRSGCSGRSLLLGAAARHAQLPSTPEAFLEPSSAPG